MLEPQALVIRGTPRLSIPLAGVTTATARDGCLTVAFDGRIVELELGSDAAKWAKRITSPPTRLAKLGVKAGQRILIAGPVDAGFVSELEAAGAVVVTRAAATPVDLVFYAVDRPTGLDRLAALAGSLVPNGALWTLRTKGQRVVTEAETMAAGKRAGLVDVKVVGFSEPVTGGRVRDERITRSRETRSVVRLA
ncbi:MAG: hypothetical protein ABI211_21020 [Vicinamibacterales bacterium]